MSGYINRYILLLKSLPLSLSVSLSPFLPSLHPSFLPSFPLCVCACTHVSINVPMQVCRCHGTCAETRNQFCASVLPSTLLETRSFVVQTCIWQASTQLSHKILGILLSLPFISLHYGNMSPISFAWIQRLSSHVLMFV